MVDTDRSTGRTTLSLAIGRAVAAALIFSLGLGLASGIGGVTTERLGFSGFLARLTPALLCTVLVLAGIGWLARRTRSTPAWFGFRRSGALLDALRGAGVVLGSAVVVFGITTLFGGLRFSTPDAGALASFILTTILIATLLEAFPEELAFRGLAYSSLRGRFGELLAGVLATVLFLIAPGLSSIPYGLVLRLFGEEAPLYRFAPVGQDAISYAMLLAVWSFTLICARRVTGSIWTGVGAHVMLLIVNRLLLQGAGPDTGLPIELASPDLIVLIPVYVALAGVGFTALRGVHRKSTGGTTRVSSNVQ